MARLLLIAGLALVTAQAAGASLLLGAHPCQEGCADDNDDGQCAPGCHDCNCCSGVRVVTPREQAAAVPPPPGRVAHPPARPFPPSADPREILHIPKLLAA
ncbi:MAG TPA: hypothetical protein VGQ83_39100 [Polyangia bacterium]